MKELSEKEKAKAYDKAFERAKGLYAKGAPDSLHLEEMFPVLKESEDERIRKELIAFVKSRLAGFPECDRFIDWLESQGEHKPDDKVEPKFHEGDWVVFNKQLNQLKKTKKNNQELTWFKKFLCNITNLGKPDEKELEELKSNAKGLLKIARKQIASEIDVEDMVEEKKDSLNLEKDAYFAFGAYRKGIEDTLKKIKEG